MLRITLTAVFVTAGVILVARSFRPTYSSQVSDLLLSLGTEIAGIAVTVAIVEWLFERRQRKQEAYKMAWRALLEIDHAVWVWQGGRRQFVLAELLGLLSAASDNDPIPDFTQNLFLILGSEAEATLSFETDITSTERDLESALQILSAELSAIRDGRLTLGPVQLAQRVRDAVKLGTTEAAPESVAKLRNTDLKAQEWRHFGKVIDDPSYRGPLADLAVGT